MDSGLYAAYTGLMARTQALDTAANNVANAGTNGFRAQRDYFRGVLVDSLRPDSSADSQVGRSVNDFGILGGTIGALAAALVAGLISGLAVSRTKIPLFIVTLGMLSVADSMAWIVAAGQPITVPSTMTPSRRCSKAFFSAKTYFRSSSSFSDLSPQACSSIGTNGDVTSTLSATTNRPRESPACR